MLACLTYAVMKNQLEGLYILNMLVLNKIIRNNYT